MPRRNRRPRIVLNSHGMFAKWLDAAEDPIESASVVPLLIEVECFEHTRPLKSCPFCRLSQRAA